MLSTIFIILMFAVVVDFFWLAIKLAWSVGKLILSFIFFPVAMILLAASGLITAALMILLIVAQMVKMIDREKMIAAEVMSREEACVEMEYTDHDFYVFRDSDRDDTLSILYKRKEKGYGLLAVDEPF